MNILVILTGGTIGSAVSDGYISPDQNQGASLIQMYTEYVTEPVHFDCISPYTILSENLNGSHLHRLTECIRSRIPDIFAPAKNAGEPLENALCTTLSAEDKKSYDGIIITHGTDTLQYTAAGLRHLFAGCRLPIVLVSSNYILADARANGFANFAAAVSFIRRQLGAGVYVAYQNNSMEGEMGPVYIHHGNRIMPYAIYSDAIYSVDGSYFCSILPQMKGGHMCYDAYELHDTVHDGSHDNKQVHTSLITAAPPAPAIPQASEGIPPIPERSGILVLYAAPGMYYPKPDETMKAVLLISYHSGTLPTDDDSFCHFTRQAYAMNIPVYVLGGANAPEGKHEPRHTTEDTHAPYESISRYDELHLKPLPVMSPVDAYMQLYLAHI